MLASKLGCHLWCVCVLAGNQISGPLPPGLTALDSLLAVRLSSNRLTGSLPLEYFQLKSLHILNLVGHC